jgi:membrane-associated protease RseP (regulator of RpoE activity)
VKPRPSRFHYRALCDSRRHSHLHGVGTRHLDGDNQQPIFTRFLSRLLLVFHIWVFIGTLCTIVGCASERGTIGAKLGRQEDGRVFIRETPLSLAAARAGLQPGDEITLVNGRDVRSFDEKGLHSILSGDVGEPVKLTVLRGEQVLHVTLQRTPAPRPLKPEKQ